MSHAPPQRQCKPWRQFRCLQINLHRAEGASIRLGAMVEKTCLDFVAIQEPWASYGNVKGLQTKTCKLVYDTNVDRPRAAILIGKHINFLPISELIQRDLVAVQAEVPSARGRRAIVLASLYLPGDAEDAVSRELQQLMAYCRKQNIQWVICCDANAHHTVWGSTDINIRGESLLDFITTNNIVVANRGDEPTFINVIRREVLDLTLTSAFISNSISNWRVLDEVSLSDHRYIRFDLIGEVEDIFQIRNVRKTDWSLYQFHLEQNIGVLSGRITNSQELNLEVNKLENLITEAFENSCELVTKKRARNAPWWSKELKVLQKKARQLFNSAKSTGDWDSYRSALTAYNRELRKSKRDSWRKYCTEIESLPAATRLQKSLNKDHSNGLSTLKKADGSFTESLEETGQLLLDTHFPDCTSVVEDSEDIGDIRFLMSTRRELSLGRKIFTVNKIKWAISTFSPFKSPGVDNIQPCLLQHGVNVLAPVLTNIFRISLELGIVPKNWGKARVAFIPKAGKKADHTPKAFRPISLTSFLLKAMEKIIDQYIRDAYLRDLPLHVEQYAYQSGKSTETAIHSLTTKIEKALAGKEIALCTSVDITGAFDNASFSSIEEGMVRKEIDRLIITWVLNMLKNRTIIFEIGPKRLCVKSTKGCPQGGVLSPLLWLLVVDELLQTLDDLGYEVQGFADDLVIMVRGRFDSTITDRMQLALDITQDWCQEKGLSINPNKTCVVPFTRRRKLSLGTLKLGDADLTLSGDMKYLGVILDKTLTWKNHLSYITKKALRAIYTCQRLYGKTWGLRPKMMAWSYKTIIVPMITYASLVWWPKVDQIKTQITLNKVYRIACLSVTGAMRTCPTTALGMVTGLIPLHLVAKRSAASAALRLPNLFHLKEGNLTGHVRILGSILNSPCLTVFDKMERKLEFSKNFKVVISDRSAWRNNEISLKPGAQVWFTDGSKMEDGSAGAGIVGPHFKKAIAMGKTTSIFQAEVHALELCARECLRRGTRGANINILSDSQAALKSLDSFSYQSKLVWECFKILVTLASRNFVTLMWVPGHEGHEGNEIADTLAKKGANTPFIGPEPFCGVNNSFKSALLREREQRGLIEHWRAQTGMRQSKRLINPERIKVEAILNLSRNDIKLYTELLTGHCKLNYHMKKIGVVENDSCRLCKEAQETTEHVLCDCPAVARRRLNYLGSGVIDPNLMVEIKPTAVLGFINSLKLFE